MKRRAGGPSAQSSARGRAAPKARPSPAPRRRSPTEGLARLEALVAQALTAVDPAAALREAALDPSLPSALRRALSAAEPDGVRMAALLIARLRFERLIRGCPEAEAWFDADPPGFSAAFRRYHAEVPPTAIFPPAEARLFRAWREATDRPRIV